MRSVVSIRGLEAKVPGIRAERRDVSVHGTALLCQPRGQESFGVGQPRPLAGPVRDVDQRRAIGVRAGLGRGWCRRSAVTYASTSAARTRSSSESPAPPQTATVLMLRSRSPETRTPCSVLGSPRPTLAANSRSDSASSSVPIRPPPRWLGVDASSSTSYAGSSYECVERIASTTARRRWRGRIISTRDSSTTSIAPTSPIVGLARAAAGRCLPRWSTRPRGRSRRSARRPPRRARRSSPASRRPARRRPACPSPRTASPSAAGCLAD